jgi:hypothetical protein
MSSSIYDTKHGLLPVETIQLYNMKTSNLVLLEWRACALSTFWHNLMVDHAKWKMWVMHVYISALNVIAGPDFGPEVEGQIQVIYKALCDLKTSSARFLKHLPEQLLLLGFT